jgi:hypothetical protein
MSACAYVRAIVRRSSISGLLAVLALVLAAAFATSASAASPLVGEWPLESSSVAGATEYTPDASGNGLALAGPVGSMRFGTEGGKFGGYLAGANSTPLQVTSPLLAPQQLTLLAWIKQSGYPGFLRYIAGRGNDGPTCSGSSYALYTGYSAIAGLHFYVRQPNPTATSAITAAPPDSMVFDGNWHLVAGTFDGSAIRLYVDGVQIGPAEPATGIGYSAPITDPSFYVDGYPPQALCSDNSDFPGQIDEVRVYDRALTQGELGLFAATSGPTPPQLPGPAEPEAVGPTPVGTAPGSSSSPSPAPGASGAPPFIPARTATAPLGVSILGKAVKTVGGVSNRPPDASLRSALEEAQATLQEMMASARDTSVVSKPQKATGLSAQQQAKIDPDPGIQARLEAMKYGLGLQMQAAAGQVVEVGATVALQIVGKGGTVTTRTVTLPPAVGTPRGGAGSVPIEIPVDAKAAKAFADEGIAKAAISIQAVSLSNPGALGSAAESLQKSLAQSSAGTSELAKYMAILSEQVKKQAEADRKNREDLASKAEKQAARVAEEIEQIQDRVSASQERMRDLMQGTIKAMLEQFESLGKSVAGASSPSLPAASHGLKPCGGVNCGFAAEIASK